LTTALVPTMGAFHRGHLSLMKWARDNSRRVIVSLFVNPTQFGPGEDLAAYPRAFERDARLAEEHGADALFAPRPEDMYSEDHATWVEVPKLTRALCARSRPGHFRGVATIVTKLLILACPNIAVFGEKDWQQLAVIRRLVVDLNLPVKIVGRPTVREDDGLAMSSRNAYLSEDERKQAPNIYAGLRELNKWRKAGEKSAQTLVQRLEEHYRRTMPSGEIDYIQIVHPRTLEPLSTVVGPALAAAAVRFGKARLIDNLLLEA